MSSSYSFTTSALDGDEWSASRPGRALPPGKGPSVLIVQEAGWAPEPVWTQRLEEKSFRLCQGSNLDRPVVNIHSHEYYPRSPNIFQRHYYGNGYEKTHKYLFHKAGSRNKPVHAGILSRNLFLLLNFIPALISIYPASCTMGVGASHLEQFRGPQQMSAATGCRPIVEESPPGGRI
jgi:hypothetical protein